MCGRYYIDSDMENEIEKVVHDIDRRIHQDRFLGDIRPTDVAPVIEMSNQRLKIEYFQMGISTIKGEKSGYQCESRVCHG